MAFGPINLLGRAVSAALPFIRLGISLGRGVAALGSIITRAFVRAEAASVRRVIEAEVQQRREVREVLGRPHNEVLSPDLMPEAITKQRRQYSWHTRFGFIDPVSGERRERHISVSTDSLLSPEEALQEAQDMLSDDYNIDASFVINSDVVGVTRAAPGRRL